MLRKRENLHPHPQVTMNYQSQDVTSKYIVSYFIAFISFSAIYCIESSLDSLTEERRHRRIKKFLKSCQLFQNNHYFHSLHCKGFSDFLAKKLENLQNYCAAWYQCCCWSYWTFELSSSLRLAAKFLLQELLNFWIKFFSETADQN